MDHFLSPSEEQEIVNAIIQAEKNTSGEIRVHIEQRSDLDAYERAKKVFFELEMQKTKERNGVLFYVCLNPKSFVILGDEKIDQVVKTENFWEGTKELIINHFKNKMYKDGLVYGILKAGKKLQEFFPAQKDNRDELSNEISKA
ncbi:TPM domain-containing protein [Myroides indicus]|uniref:TLP18.3/Psb32/MOLO-1 phosphatase superfamily protein n=1 Tax=Myroides indicus TaxID=1323422 RepID=A0A4R7F103_9FLAO|nr:TPM domain-containing protein [Myroides indicus]TDS62107.1 TLP18.3/Psb32/MOLO-1 phosphatase superfamily protein [Myroides indicus]